MVQHHPASQHLPDRETETPLLLRPLPADPLPANETQDEPGRPQGPAPGSLADMVSALEKEAQRLRRAEKALLESNDALTLLSETANELLSTERPQEVIGILFEKLSARLGLDAYFNYLVDEQKGKLHLNSYGGIPPDVAGEIEWLEYGQAICGCVARDGCRIVAEDVQRSADVRADLIRSFGIMAYACHPLIAHDRVIGTFSFGSSRKPHFEPHELALMQAVCDQVSMAMSRIVLISELRRRETFQRLLADASALLAASLDYEKTLPSLACLISESVADWCIFDLAEGPGSFRRLAVGTRGADSRAIASQLEECQLLALEEVQSLERVLRTGEAEIYAETSESVLATFSRQTREQRRLAELGVASILIAPLAGRQGPLGVMTWVSTRTGLHFGSDDLSLAQEMANRAAIAVENARLYRLSREAIHARDEFLSVAAHELKTPMTSLRGFAQTMLRQLEKGKTGDPLRLQRMLQVIDRQSEKLSQLVTQLLDVSQIDAGWLTIERKTVEIGELVRGVVDSVQLMAPSCRVVVRIHEPIWSAVDSLRIEQVVSNLLDNAVKFSPEDGKIDVDIWSPEIGTVKVAVRDRGTGIPPDQREHLFDRFYRAHAADHSSGIGLGLYISRHIVELHGGKIEAEFPTEGGVRMIISLPTTLADVKRQFRHERDEVPR